MILRLNCLSDLWSFAFFGIADPVFPLAGAIPCEVLDDSVIAEPESDIANPRTSKVRLITCVGKDIIL